TRRNHHSLLRSADQNVDAPAVDVKVRCAQSGNAINDQQSLGRSVLEQLRNRLDVVTHGGGGLSCLEVNGAMLRLQSLFHFGQVEGLAVGHLHHVDFATEGL